jgi:hypothetical protein
MKEKYIDEIKKTDLDHKSLDIFSLAQVQRKALRYFEQS